MSILWTASKVWEELVEKQILNGYKTIPYCKSKQFQEMPKVVEDIKSATDRQEVTAVLFLDLRKAFDTVLHRNYESSALTLLQ